VDVASAGAAGSGSANSAVLGEGAMRRLLPSFRRLVGWEHAGVGRRGDIEPDVESIRGTVSKVLDGDTIHVCDERGRRIRIRLLSIDTPETHFFGASQGYWGERASARLAELLPLGSEVEVRTDAQKCDTYGRVLGYVYSGARFINRQMLAEGLAVNYVIAPNLLHVEEFAEIVKKNVVLDRGIFGDPDLQIPYEYRWSSRKRSHVRYVGSVSCHEVYRVARRELVAVWDRVFFNRAEDVCEPFVLVGERERRDAPQEQ
jgi:micrococcal nuclease